MKSFCIKDNNIMIMNYLKDELLKINSSDFIFTEKSFSKYNNFIIHYIGNNKLFYYNVLTDLIYKCILKIYEPEIINTLVLTEYFYFDLTDIKKIEKNCFELLDYQNSNYLKITDLSDSSNNRKIYLWSSILEYITSHKSIVLDGFINFRIKDYKKCLDEVIDTSVNQFVIDKEYEDFINLIKLYISSRSPKKDIIYLIYDNGKSTLLDENKNIIKCEEKILNTNYLSDISFSSNDYTLNSLLSLLPTKLVVILHSPEDEFITTLKLIFEDRIHINEQDALFL